MRLANQPRRVRTVNRARVAPAGGAAAKATSAKAVRPKRSRRPAVRLTDVGATVVKAKQDLRKQDLRNRDRQRQDRSRGRPKKVVRRMVALKTVAAKTVAPKTVDPAKGDPAMGVAATRGPMRDGRRRRCAWARRQTRDAIRPTATIRRYWVSAIMCRPSSCARSTRSRASARMPPRIDLRGLTRENRPGQSEWMASGSGGLRPVCSAGQYVLVPKSRDCALVPYVAFDLIGSRLD